MQSVHKNERNIVYKLLQQHKQLKTIQMNEAWPDTYDEGSKYQL